MVTSITSVIFSRFILSLRSIYHSSSTYSSTTATNDLSRSQHDPTQQRSTVYFASIIEGNLGATLSTSWGSGRETDVDEDEDIPRYSEYPFETGLKEEGDEAL